MEKRISEAVGNTERVPCHCGQEGGKGNGQQVGRVVGRVYALLRAERRGPRAWKMGGDRKTRVWNAASAGTGDMVRRPREMGLGG